jgi:hypothetical protein
MSTEPQGATPGAAAQRGAAPAAQGEKRTAAGSGTRVRVNDLVDKVLVI